MHRPRVLLADDHSETRKLLCGLLESEFDVVADVPDGHALIRAAQQLSPDVIVTDISMPGIDGITAATLILHTNPAARIVLVTVHGDPTMVERGMASGAVGYVLKHAAGDDLLPAVRAALCERRLGRSSLTASWRGQPNR